MTGPATGPAIRHVLLDADEVLQHPGAPQEAAGPYAARITSELIADLGVLNTPAMTGEIDFFVEFRRLALRHGIEVDPADLFALMWRSIVVDPTSLALVDRLRAAGYGVHLGTNQEHHRARYMRETLGLDESRFDVAVYSCEIGLAKPDPAYFEKAVAMIGADPATVLFVDDKQPNVDGARSVGLAAERWELADGHPRLAELLAGHGVAVAGWVGTPDRPAGQTD
ncbi:HAD family hydrolase [Nocardioides mangrovi]|uniref:HAD-IA family hydrolase n=1 Tax=Nocardioides mangrovi TaxID=2874580 RepID=A0ABS7UFD6_9ACTN|nr:HAD-IA family hydrolase [Nocardioides mangrovi]MBZ5739713.1 HAD-IA family hydrolase [Nocardioides mangrovi]